MQLSRYTDFLLQDEDDDLVAEGDDGPTRLHPEPALRRVGARKAAAKDRLDHQRNDPRFSGVHVLIS